MCPQDISLGSLKKGTLKKQAGRRGAIKLSNETQTEMKLF